MENLQKAYENTINSWQKGQEEITDNLREILNRGFWLCLGNPKGGILLSGINPSYDKKEKAEYCSFKKCFGRYWNRWKNNLQEYIAQDVVGYIDLFPLRVTKQTAEFERHVPLELKAEILRVTQKEIEDLCPKLIIHSNKTSTFYYGTEPEHPWMGYDLERLEIVDELKDKGCELYRISGLLESKDRINYHSIKETSIAGSFLFTCPMQNRRYMKAEEKLDERDIVNLCKQLNI